MRTAIDRVERWAAARHDVISAEQARRLGLPRPWPQRLAARGEWQRLLRGIYLTDPLRAPTAVEIAVAARLFAGGGIAPRGTVTGPVAARLWGLDVYAAGPAEVLLPPSVARRQPHGLRYGWAQLAAEDRAVRDGVAVTSARATLRRLAAASTAEQSLVVGDSALRTGLITREGLVACDAGYAAADGRSESVLESRVRAELLAAGLPPPELQWEVRFRGAVVARVDFAWPGAGLVVEADGADTHTGAAALRRDLTRQNALVSLGLTVLRFTWADVGRIAHPVRLALARAA